MKFRQAVMSDFEQQFTHEQKMVEAERPYNADIKLGKPNFYVLKCREMSFAIGGYGKPGKSAFIFKISESDFI